MLNCLTQWGQQTITDKQVITVIKLSPSTLGHRAIGSRKDFLGPIGVRTIVDYVLLHLRAFLEKPTPVSASQSEMAVSEFCDPGEGTGVTPKITSDNAHACTMAKKAPQTPLVPSQQACPAQRIGCVTGNGLKQGEK